MKEITKTEYDEILLIRDIDITKVGIPCLTFEKHIAKIKNRYFIADEYNELVLNT